MTEQEIVTLGEKAAEPENKAPAAATPAAPNGNGNTNTNGPSYPADWPEAAIKKINQQHGQKIGLHAKLDEERKQRAALEARLRDVETERRRLQAEMPVYQKMAIDQSSARYDLENKRAAEGLARVFTTGDLTPEALGTHVGNVVTAKLSQIELKRAADDLATQARPSEAAAQAPQKDYWDQLEADGKVAVKRHIYNADAAQFMAKHGFNLNSDDSTVAGKKKNAAVLLDKSAVLNGYPVGSLAYWEFIDDGLRRAVPEERSRSGTDDTQTEAPQSSARVIPSVAAPAARNASAVNGGPRKKPELSEFDREFLRRNPKVKEEDILREIALDLERESGRR